MKRASIRRRLLAGVATVQVLAVVLATVLVVQHERTRSYAMLEAELVEHAAMVTSVVEAPDNPGASAILHRELLMLPKEDVYILTDARGRVIAASGAWSMQAVIGSERRTFVDIPVAGQRYRALIERDITMFDDDTVEMARLPKLTLVYGAPTERVEEHVRTVAWTAAGLGLAILVASLLAAGWVVRSGLRPVTELAASAAKIDATHWEWGAVGGKREVEELAPLSTALTRLLERLREAFVRERQFSADAAHEMKTAVAIVKSTLELALERGGSAAEYRAELARALDDTERMQGLVVGMLQLAKIEGLSAAGADEQISPDAGEGIREAVRRLAPVLDARGMRVEVDAPEAAMPARIPAESLALVLVNLLENAIHYSADGSAIEVKAEGRGDMWLVTVTDSGCGIDPQALPHIFERFYRGDSSRSRESGGAGLGLAIVKAILHQAGGTVTAVSTLGTGSVFTVSVPRS